jgi:putative membrane protein
MNMTARMVVIGLAAVTLACDTARRDDASANRDYGTTIGTAGVGSGDREFVETSMGSGMLEVELGKIAQQKATNPEVKQFADMMIRDHSKAGEELKQVAQQHSLQAQAQLEDNHRDLIQRLSGLSGAEFDREYMNAMVDSHQDVIDHLQSRADVDRFGDNQGSVSPEPSDNPVESSLNQWAAETLPTTRHHLDEARRINDSLGNRLTQDSRR